MVQEIAHSFQTKRNGKGILGMKRDVQKAYDMMHECGVEIVRLCGKLCQNFVKFVYKMMEEIVE